MDTCESNGRIRRIETPVSRGVACSLRAGDMVLLSGEVLVFRDEVHRIVCDLIAKGEPLPFELENAALYYCGPTPGRHGRPVGSAGPTTAGRMDRFTGPLLERGLALTIGKGNRSPEVRELLRKHGAAYLAAVGGAGALLGGCIEASRVVAFPELGPEAARIFTVRDMPLIVALDCAGGSAFAEGKQ
jgi:fumarate hydratase subunit beta